MLDYNEIKESEFSNGIRYSDDKKHLDDLIATFQKVLSSCDISKLENFHYEDVKIWANDEMAYSESARRKCKGTPDTVNKYTVFSCENENYIICFENDLNFPSTVKNLVKKDFGVRYLRFKKKSKEKQKNFLKIANDVIKIAFRVKLKEITDSQNQKVREPLASLCIKQNENEQFVYVMKENNDENSLKAEKVFERLGYSEFYEKLTSFIQNLKTQWNSYLDNK